MATLILPAAGLSTRYGLSRPKFLLQHPKGKTMLTEGLSGLDFQNIQKVVFVSLKTYFESIDIQKLIDEIESTYGIPVKSVLLDNPTSSMVETIIEGIRSMDEDDSIILKDCDNFISATFPAGENFVVYAKVEKFPSVLVANKSFVKLDANGYLSSIVEKRVVSDNFNTGLVGFARASEFLFKATEFQASNNGYVSSIIESLIDEGEFFKGISANGYHDWGTLKEWRDHCSLFSTFFVDLDGVLVENEHPLSLGEAWNDLRPITSNVEALLERQRSGVSKIVFTTSRSESYRDSVYAGLCSLGFENFDLVMGLPHAKRYLINDYAPSNPYPTAVALNLERGTASLAGMLPTYEQYPIIYHHLGQ